MILALVSLSLAGPLFARRADPPPIEEPAPESTEPTPVETATAWQPATGSLFDPTRVSMMTGMSGRSRQLGDLITVLVDESGQSQVDASTQTSAAGSTEFGVTSALGLEVQAANANESLSSGLSVGLSKNTSHAGNGTVSRGSQIVDRITCTIEGVLPNGNLLIRGTKQIFVNGERQYVTLIGVASPRDVSSDNTIYSWRLADTEFESTGRGVVADKQKVGWGQRLVDNLAP